jgi:hypothetical protein
LRRIHLLRVEAEPAAFAPLFAATEAIGLRVGWLEFGAGEEPPAPLAAALAAGGDRAVSVAERATVAVRRRRGPAALRELLRQQFLGCELVLVRGEVDAPRLSVDGDALRVATADGAERRWAPDQLAAALRRPQPFAPATPAT